MHDVEGLAAAYAETGQFDLAVAEARVGGNTTLTVDADLFDLGVGGTHRPSHEVVTLGRTGVRGSYGIAQT